MTTFSNGERHREMKNEKNAPQASENTEEEFTLTWDDAKMWLFRESIRQQEVREELEEERRRMSADLEREMEAVEGKLNRGEESLARQEELVEKKLEILRREYLRLDAERRKLEADRKQFEEEKKTYETIRRFTRPVQNITYIGADILFQGVNGEAALKKRYRDLLKIFHPDNLGGDNTIIQNINEKYEDLKKKYS